MTGLDRLFSRTQDFGLTYPKTAVPVVSMGIGTLEVHPIDLLGAYGTIADGGVHVPRQVISSVVDANGKTVWPLTDLAQKGSRVISSGAAAIITDILAGNTDTKVNPYWGKWAIYDGKTRRPAAYKTGHDQRQPRRGGLRLPGPAGRRVGAGPGRRGLDGQQRQHAERRQAVARYLGAALVGDPDRDQPRPADRRLQADRAIWRRRPSTRSPACSPARSPRRPSMSCSCRARCRPRRRASG